MNRYIKLLATSVLLAACSTTNEDDRWEPTVCPIGAFNSQVFIEEYTGQDCIYCPDAASTLKKLYATYGERMIWVSMHDKSNRLVRSELASEEAEAYRRRFSLAQAIPGIMINRRSMGQAGLYSQSRDLWAGLIASSLCKPTTYDINLKAKLNGDELFTEVVANPLYNNIGKDNLMLQLWLVEDVEAYQILPGGGKENYQHHQVLRTALNGTWGKEYQPSTFYRKTTNIGGKLKDNSRGKVLAFVYDKNSKEVLRAEIVALGANSNSGDNGGGEHSITRPLLNEVSVWYRASDRDYRSGDEMLCTSTERRTLANGEELVEIASPLFYLMPGQTHASGKYTLKATKLDALEDSKSGISQFCAAGQCLAYELPPNETTSDEITITDSKLNGAQSVYVHYKLGAEALTREGRYKLRLDLYKGESIVSTLTLVFVYKP